MMNDDGGRYPFGAFPAGWFVAALSTDLGPGQVLPLQRFGRELVLFRTEAGAPHILDAHCPHLGTHLGHGGRVQGDTLICPAHRRRYDPSGRCVEIPCDRAAALQGELRAWPVEEVNGFILVHYHESGLEPSWRVPALDPLLSSEWLAPKYVHLPIRRANVWEMAADTADCNHFRFLHGFQDPVLELRPQGPTLDGTMRFKFDPERYIGMKLDPVDAVTEQTLYGLGLQTFTTRFRLGGVPIETYIATAEAPIADDRIAVCYAFSMKKLADADITATIASSLESTIVRGFDEDHAIHEHRIYIARPPLSAGDGPIAAFRRWTLQFYPDPSRFDRNGRSRVSRS